MPPFKAAWCCRHVSGFRYADETCQLYHRSMRVLIVEDEPYMAEAIRDGLRLEAIAADIAGDGDTALELLRFNAYDIAVLDPTFRGPPVTRSPTPSSPPAAACRSSCSPLPTGSTTRR